MYVRRLNRLGSLAGGALALALATGLAHAASDNRGEYELGLSARTPDTATGLRFHVGYRHPSNPGAKPPPTTAASFDLPQGIRIDGGAVPSCNATDEEFRAMGRDACPAASRVGTGRLVAITGFGGPVDPVEGDVTVFNGGDELTEVVFAKGTNTVLGMDRIEIRGNRLIAHPPVTPGGPPDGRTSIRSIDLELPTRRGVGGRPFVRTPGSCPADRRWRSTARYAFADGGTTTLTTESPCTGTTGKRRAAARLSVRPRRVRAFRWVSFRFRARGACGRRAKITLAGRSVRTDRRGRATMRLRLGRTGRRPVRVAKQGCPPARAFVRVLAAR